MDFNDTPGEAKFRAEARSFLERHTEPLAPGATPSGPFIGDDPDSVRRSKDWQALKFDHGWACLTWPTEHGGRGLGPMEQVIWTQEELRRRTPTNIFTIGIGMLGPTLMKHGTEEQKTRHLRKMARGDEVWCQLFSEPGAGSDVAGLTTRARRDGPDWILDGQKTWNTGAHFCKWGIIIVRTDPAVPKHRGLTCFIVDMESEGIDIRPIRQMDGGGGFNDVFFSGVRVPDENRLGAVDDGWRVAITTLMNERAAIGARGMAGFGPADLVRLAREADGPRGKAIEDSGVRARIADFHVRSAGLRYTTYRTLTALSRGETPGPENAIHKLVGSPPPAGDGRPRGRASGTGRGGHGRRLRCPGGVARRAGDAACGGHRRDHAQHHRGAGARASGPSPGWTRTSPSPRCAAIGPEPVGDPRHRPGARNAKRRVVPCSWSAAKPCTTSSSRRRPRPAFTSTPASAGRRSTWRSDWPGCDSVPRS